MGLVKANLSELNGRVNHWTDFFQSCPRSKVSFFRGKPSEPHCEEIEKSRFRDNLSLSCLYLGARLGFAVRPKGYWLRQLEPKKFFVDDGGAPAFYASQAFDDRVEGFRRTDPVFILEGVLDVEVFSEITGYPCVIGCLTSSVPHNLAMMLGMLVNRVILVPDNDSGGKTNYGWENVKFSVGSLKRFGVIPDVLKFEDFKDFGDVWTKKEMHSLIRAKVNAVL